MRWQQYIDPLARQYELDPYMIAAIIAVESSNNPKAYRYEEGYKWLYKPATFAKIFRDLGMTVATERAQQRASWGLCQVMGAVARERGCMEPFLTRLDEPEHGIYWGIKQLVWLRDIKGYTGEDLVSAYNQGSPKKLHGRYVNQQYVNKYKKALDTLWEDEA